MKGKPSRVLATVLLAALIIGMGIGPAIAGEQVKVNINKAAVDELAALKHIGSSYAQRIVDYRNEHGPFAKPEDIMKVQGIGTRTYEANKDIITCE